MKIAIAMSGGIDSTMAALLLQKAGHQVIGITAKMFANNIYNRAEQDNRHIQDTKIIAKQFSFEHHVIDISEDFRKSIIVPFCTEYLNGRTPNPCILCNPTIKFNKLLKFASELGCEKLATGHYASITNFNNGRYAISTAKDINRDQSYFLAMLPQHYLNKIIFPLGQYTKKQIRDMATNFNVHIANKSDSQEICFISDNDYATFITQITGITPPPGNVVNSQGIIIGQHTGIHKYTIGQRRGLGISAPRPLYVIAINRVHNTIIAGNKEELERKSILAININHMKETDLHNKNAIVKCRSTQPGSPALLKQTDQGIIATFNSPQNGISPGQAAVFYDTAMDILGAGIIEKSYI